MKSELKEFFAKDAEKKEALSITPEQLQEILKAAVSAGVSEATRMNPLEQKKFDEEIAKDKRRNMLAVELGYADELKKWNKQMGCTHSRHASTGDAVAKGTGTWTTCGQTHGDDSISLICMRCGTHWHFQATAAERDYANNAGLLGFAPPPVERCINKHEFVSAAPVPPAALTHSR